MDFGEKAKAIWAALDDMAEKSPDRYKEFINDQLNGDGAKDMWKQLGLGEGFKGPKNKSSGKVKKSENKSGQNAPTSTHKAATPTKKRSVLTTNKERMPISLPKPKETPSQSSSGSHSHPPSTSLLDDAFSNSHLIVNPLLAQIMADDEGDEEMLTDLQLPEEGGGDKKSQTKQRSKPLIEEL